MSLLLLLHFLEMNALTVYMPKPPKSVNDRYLESGLNDQLKHFSSSTQTLKQGRFFQRRGENISSPQGRGFSRVWQADWVSHSSAGQGWTPGELSCSVGRAMTEWLIDWPHLSQLQTVPARFGWWLAALTVCPYWRSQVRVTPAGVCRQIVGSPFSGILWFMNLICWMLNNESTGI